MKQQEGSIFVCQKKYTKDSLKRFGMLNCKNISTPMNRNEKLQASDGSWKTNSSRYRRLVRGLLYLTHTHPDIIYTVGSGSRFMQDPTMHHLGAMKGILHYVGRSVNFGTRYDHMDCFKLSGFMDSDWGGCVMIEEALQVGSTTWDPELLPGAQRCKT